MREVVDLVDSVASTWTRTVRMVIIGGIVVVAIIMLTVSLTAPAVIEEVGDRAESISDKAMQTAREEGRAHALAQEGWGYSDANSGAANSAAGDFADTPTETSGERYGEPAEDWGEPTE
jgi:hypothetical protein